MPTAHTRDIGYILRSKSKSVISNGPWLRATAQPRHARRPTGSDCDPIPNPAAHDRRNQKRRQFRPSRCPPLRHSGLGKVDCVRRTPPGRRERLGWGMAEVREAPVSASPEDMLRAAYPGRLRRARAERWLAFIAWRSPADEPFGWWQVPLWLNQGELLWPRRLVTTALVWAGFGLALGAYNGGGIGLSSGLMLGVGAAGCRGNSGLGSMPSCSRWCRDCRGPAVKR